MSRSTSSLFRSLALAAGVALTFVAAAYAEDSILIGDYSGSRIMKCAFPSGYAQSHFVGTGMADLSRTRGMAWGPDGNLYIASDFNDKIIRVDSSTGTPTPTGTDGTFVAAAAGGLNQPMGITFGPDGRLYVASFITNSVIVYNGVTGGAQGLFVAAAAGGLNGPYGLAFNGGFLYVSSYNTNQVLRYDGTTGAFIDIAVASGQNGLTQPRGIVFDSVNNMYVTSGSNAIIKKNPSTGFTTLASISTIPLLNNPHLLSFTPDEKLMVPCFGNGTVQLVDRTSGASLGTLTLGGVGGSASAISVIYKINPQPCYPNCDNSSVSPILNVQDFTCFLTKFAAGCPQP